MVINKFKGFLGTSGKIFVRGSFDSLIDFLKDIYKTDDVKMNNVSLVVEGTTDSSGIYEEIIFEEPNDYFATFQIGESVHQISINIGSFDIDTNHRGYFVNKLLGYSIKHSLEIIGFAFDDFHLQALKFSMRSGRNLKTIAIDYDKLADLIVE